MHQQSKVKRTVKAGCFVPAVGRLSKWKMDQRLLLGLRVMLPTPIVVRGTRRTSGCVASTDGCDNYVVLVRGMPYHYTGEQLVDLVLC